MQFFFKASLVTIVESIESINFTKFSKNGDCFRLLAAQMKYVGIFCLFLQIVMASVGVHDGHPDWTNPHTYVKVIRIMFHNFV